MAKFATHMGDPHGDAQTSPQHADPHEFIVLWIGVLWAGLRVGLWITHAGGKFRDGLLGKSLMEVPDIFLPDDGDQPEKTWGKLMHVTWAGARRRGLRCELRGHARGSPLDLCREAQAQDGSH